MNESAPVDSDELIYRRIHRSFFDPSIPMPVQREAFRPNQNDITGLSVFRARFAQPIDTFANVDPVKARDCFVAALSVHELQNQGLSVVPEPIDGGPAGHAVIPELSWPNYQSQKQYWKPILLELAKLAGQDIVHRPS